jgi:hypothetical protein
MERGGERGKVRVKGKGKEGEGKGKGQDGDGEGGVSRNGARDASRGKRFSVIRIAERIFDRSGVTEDQAWQSRNRRKSEF